MNTDLRVAVCTNRSPDAALAALRAQVPSEALAVVVSGREDPAFLSEPRPGLSHARNRALRRAFTRSASRTEAGTVNSASRLVSHSSGHQPSVHSTQSAPVTAIQS